MARIGIITAPALGHVYPFTFIGKELVSRGHSVVFFNIEELRDKVIGQGLEYCTIGGNLVKPGAMNQLQKDLAGLSGMQAMNAWQKNNARLITVMCLLLPKAIKVEGVDFLLVDQSDACGGSVADYLGIPYITVSIGNNMNWEPSIPPTFTAWSYGTRPVHIKRNMIGIQEVIKAFKPILDVVNQFRVKWGLPVYENDRDIFPVSGLAQIAQLPHFLDFPRMEQPECYQSVGPFRGALPVHADFPFDRLNGKPMIFASLGTVVNLKAPIFLEIVKAAAAFDVQLVIAVGSTVIPPELQDLGNDTIVVTYAPQFEVLKRATICITHAGLNTVLDALGNGVPLIAIPISFDQPGTAERIRYHKLGEVVEIKKIFTPSYLSGIFSAMLTDDTYRNNAKAFQEKLQELPGVTAAADIIEQHLTPNYKTKQQNELLSN